MQKRCPTFNTCLRLSLAAALLLLTFGPCPLVRLQSLLQATTASTDQWEHLQAERQERDEQWALLRAEVAQLRALGASKEHEAAAATARVEGECRVGMGRMRGAPAARPQPTPHTSLTPACPCPVPSGADLQSQVAAAKEQEAVAEQAVAMLRQQAGDMQQQLDRAAAAAQRQADALAALQAERDTLLADQQQLMQALAEQSAAAAAGGSAATPLGTAVSPPSPAPPSLDVIAMLRDQTEALKAQHEAALTVRWAAGGADVGPSAAMGACMHAACLASITPVPLLVSFPAHL